METRASTIANGILEIAQADRISNQALKRLVIKRLLTKQKEEADPRIFNNIGMLIKAVNEVIS